MPALSFEDITTYVDFTAKDGVATALALADFELLKADKRVQISEESDPLEKLQLFKELEEIQLQQVYAINNFIQKNAGYHSTAEAAEKIRSLNDHLRQDRKTDIVAKKDQTSLWQRFLGYFTTKSNSEDLIEVREDAAARADDLIGIHGGNGRLDQEAPQNVIDDIKQELSSTLDAAAKLETDVTRPKFKETGDPLDLARHMREQAEAQAKVSGPATPGSLARQVIGASSQRVSNTSTKAEVTRENDRKLR